MPHPHDTMRFGRIETRARMANGKVVQRSITYPGAGADKAEYDRIDADMRRAFGNDATTTIGAPVGHPHAISYLSASTPAKRQTELTVAVEG